MSLTFVFRLAAVIFIISAAATTTATKLISAHRCIHDSAELREFHDKFTTELYFPAIENAAGDEDNMLRRHANELSVSSTIPIPIRFNVSTIDLFNASRYCNQVNQTVMDFKSGSLVCDGDAAIFTSAKRDDLLNIFLPDALDRIRRMIYVIPLNDGRITGLRENSAQPHIIPASWVAVDGADNITAVLGDFALVVSAGPTPDGNVAWAGSAVFATGPGAGINTGRPVLGRINVSPRYIPDAATMDRREKEAYVRTLIHELLHALGYSWSHFENRFRVPGATVDVVKFVTTRGGAPNWIFNTTTAAAAARAFYGCNDTSAVEGIYLENEGGSGTINSHIERTVAYEDIMTGVEGVINQVSNLSLAIMFSMPYYFPPTVIEADNTTTRSNVVFEPMSYGNNSGCEFLTQKCNDARLSQRAKGLFAFEFSKPTLSCPYNLRNTGRVVISNFSGPPLPAEWLYYGSSFPSQGGAMTLFDYCAFTQPFPTFHCNDGNESTGTFSEMVLGYSRGPGSRCVHAPELVDNLYVTPTYDNSRCVMMQCGYENCSDGGVYRGTESPHLHGAANCDYILRIKVHNSMHKTTWQSCHPDGGVLPSPPDGFKGDIQCPPARHVCDPWGYGFGEDLPFVSLATTSSTTTSTTTATTTTTIMSSTTVITTPSGTTDANAGATTSTTDSSPSSSPSSGIGGVSSTTEAPAAPGTTSTQQQGTTTTSAPPPPAPPGMSTTSAAATTAPGITLGTTKPKESTTAVAGGVTTAAGGNGGGSGSLAGDISPAACFLAGLPCFVSYILIALACLVLLLFFFFLYKKMCSGSSDSGGAAKGRTAPAPAPQRETVADEPLLDTKFSRMAQEMKNMSPQQATASLSPSPVPARQASWSPQSPAFGGPTLSPSQMCISPRAAPIFIDDDL